MSDRVEFNKKKQRGYPEVCTYSIKSEDDCGDDQQGTCFKLSFNTI